MKEPSIEQKAKAYDEALERARKELQACGSTDCDAAKQIFRFFHELKESEDERIRKELIKHLKDGVEGYMPAGDSEDYARWLAWVEKQGSEPNWCHHKVDLSNCSEEYRKAYYDGWNNCNQQHSQCKSEENDVVKCLINGMKFYYEGNEEATWGTEKFPMKVRDILSWLEKQGKETSEKEFTFKALPRLLEMIEVSDRAKAYTEKLAVALDNEGYHTDAKIVRESIKIMNGEEVSMATMDEQKPVDNIEPKFKVGDWIVWQNKCYKVNYNGCGYELIDQNGLSTSLEYGTVDKSAHLWAIQDAKDGDVLINKNYMGESPFIFKETKPSNIKTDVSNPLTIFGYCGIGGAGFTKSSGWGDTANCIYHPATKEQRDTLLKAMAEAGYEWDSEKKEQKEIDPKPYGQRKECLDCQFNYVGECKGSCQMKRDEQKPNLYFKAKDWYVSKVDGKIYNAKFMEKTSTNQARKLEIEKAAMSATGILKQEEWFIKGAEWSDKNPSYISSEKQDEQKPQRMVSAEAKEALYDKPTDEEMKELLRTEYEKGRADTLSEMKSSWSEEDERAIGIIKIALKHPYDMEGKWDRKFVLDWLKSLKDRYIWKPSEEQMNTLNLIISDYYHACTKECDKKAIVLKSILEQLKQL